jgi:hypothetical protein
MTKTPERIKFRGAFYRKALMLRRPPDPEPAGAAPPGGPPNNYERLKQCILSEVPGHEAECDKLMQTAGTIDHLRRALGNFGSALAKDDLVFWLYLQKVQEKLTVLQRQAEDLVFLGQQAHRELKHLKPHG